MRPGAGQVDFSKAVGGGRAETGKGGEAREPCTLQSPVGWTTGAIEKINTKHLELVTSKQSREVSHKCRFLTYNRARFSTRQNRLFLSGVVITDLPLGTGSHGGFSSRGGWPHTRSSEEPL